MRRHTLSAVFAVLLIAACGLAALFWADVLTWTLDQQRQLHRDLAQALRGVAGDGGVGAGWSLVAVSFVYGVLHAAGPGHGKMVIAAYLGTQDGRLKGGVLLAAAAALLQGVVAIALVDGLAWAVGGLANGSGAAVAWSERVSFVVLIALGGAFVWRGGRGMVASLAGRHPAPDHHHGHDHHHHHHHDGACGCAHGPVDTGGGGRTMAAMVLSIGLRPCTGAVLVLALANTLDLDVAGMAAVMAMALGTAIAMVGLAVAVIRARAWMTRAAAGRPGRPGPAGFALSLAGGLAILAFGLSLLAASFAPAHPLL